MTFLGIYAIVIYYLKTGDFLNFMEFKSFLTILSRKRKTVYGVMALFLVLAIALIAVQRFKYSAESQLLVVQEYSGVVDAYTASKSSEHLSSVLASVVSSNSFYTKVITTSPSINTAYFGSNPKDQVREWGNTVKAQSINDSGIIAITVYHPDKTEAEKIAGAVNYVLMTQHSAYDGAGEAVKVRLIDQPIASSFPVKPNVPLILLTSVVLAGIFSVMYIYLVSDPYQASGLRREVVQIPAVSQPTTQTYNQPANSLRDEHSERPVAQQDLGYRAFTSPYGQREQVSVRENTQPQPSFDRVNNNSSFDDISQQGNMRNILG